MDERLFPVYICGVSIATLALQTLINSGCSKQQRAGRGEPHLSSTEQQELDEAVPVSKTVKDHISDHGGRVIYAYKVLSFISCLVILVFSLSLWIPRDRLGDRDLFAPSIESWMKIAGIGAAVSPRTILALAFLIGRLDICISPQLRLSHSFS